MIHEVVIITRGPDGLPHLAPMGYREVAGDGARLIVLSPFRPSITLDNLSATGCATLNMTDNVAVIAGCLTGRREWPLERATSIDGWRLADTLAHVECEVLRREEDPQRPRFFLRPVAAQNHAPFRGYNRAQAAVLELAILASRLHMLPMDKIDAEIAYLGIAIDKTADVRERQAWNWLMERVEAHRRTTLVNDGSIAS